MTQSTDDFVAAYIEDLKRDCQRVLLFPSGRKPVQYAARIDREGKWRKGEAIIRFPERILLEKFDKVTDGYNTQYLVTSSTVSDYGDGSIVTTVWCKVEN